MVTVLNLRPTLRDLFSMSSVLTGDLIRRKEFVSLIFEEGSKHTMTKELLHHFVINLNIHV